MGLVVLFLLKLGCRSNRTWDREQEIVHDAGGEILFAEILNRHADKIIIGNDSDGGS